MNTRALAAVLALVAVPLAARAPGAGRLAPTRLRCEYAVDPLGIDTAKPRLFWQVESMDRGERQTAWHILVAASDADDLPASIPAVEGVDPARAGWRGIGQRQIENGTR